MNRTASSESAAASRWTAYWHESAQPLPSLVFVLPLIVIYEVGTIVMGREAIRNGADVLLRSMLDLLGLGQYFLLPLATCGLLLAWHHTTRRPWRFPPAVLPGMWIEAVLLGLLLLGIAYLHGAAYHRVVTAAGATHAPLGASLVAFCGAGVYEELLFRLVLLSGMIAAIRAAGGTPKATVIVAVILVSLLFSAAHYQPFTAIGDAFAWNTFLFRFLAGVFFSAVYLMRGFGIAAGAHTLYDVLVVIS